jgi:hypothetical protein
LLEFEGRNAVASSTGRRALIGAWEKTVAVRDLQKDTTSRAIETVFDAGGHRLALSDQLDGLVAAAYNVHGLAFYSCTTGCAQWKRKDLKKIQCITLSKDGLTAYCGREAASLAEVDLRSGETIRTIRGARALYESSFEAIRLLDTKRPQVLDGTGNRLFALDRTTFAFLDVSFAPGFLVVSESGGPVRCIDSTTGVERWRYKPKSGRHVLNLGYRNDDSCVLGVEWPYEIGGSKTLVRWSLKDGDILDRKILGQPFDCCFGLGGKVIVLADGSVIPTS